jgi:hypothetical protein
MLCGGDMDNLLEALKQWQFYLISFVASIVSYKDIWNKEDSWRLTLVKFGANFATSLFAGLVALLICRAVEASLAWTWFFIAMFAWRGSKALEAAAKIQDGILQRWTGAQNSEPPNKPPG